MAATLDDVRAILSSNDDPSHKLDRLGRLLFPAPEEPAPAPAVASAPKPKPRAVKPEPDPDAA